MSLSLTPGLSSAKSFEPLDPIHEPLDALIDFRERIEYNAQRYLDGHPLFIASAFTRGAWAGNLTRDRPFIVSPTRTRRTRPWYAKSWRHFPALESPQDLDNTARTRPSTWTPKPSSCFKPYLPSQDPAALALNLEAQRAGHEGEEQPDGGEPNEDPQKHYCRTWLTHVANEGGTTNAIAHDVRSASSSASPLVEHPAIAQEMQPNGADHPFVITDTTFAAPSGSVTQLRRNDFVDDHLPPQPRIFHVVPAELDVVSVDSHTEDDDIRRRVFTPHTSDHDSSRSVIELHSNSAREVMPHEVASPSHEPLAVEALVEETYAVVEDPEVGAVRPRVVEIPTSVCGEVTPPSRDEKSLNNSDAVAKPAPERHMPTTVEQSKSVPAHRPNNSTSSRSRSVHESAAAHAKQFSTIPVTVAKPRPMRGEPRSHDQRTILDHAENHPPGHSTTELLFCKDCGRGGFKLLFKGVQGAKTACRKCANKFKQDTKIEEAVVARMALARRPEPSPRRQTAYRGKPYEDASAAMSGHPKRQRLSNDGEDVVVTTIAETEHPQIDHGHKPDPSSRSDSNSTPTVKDKKGNQTKVSTPVTGKALSTPLASIIKQMLGKKPLQELENSQPYVRSLLADDTKPFFQNLLKARDSRLASGTKSNSMLARARQDSAITQSKKEQPAPVIPGRKRRLMTFDTPVLGQRSKRPRIAKDAVAGTTEQAQDEVGRVDKDDAIMIQHDEQMPAKTGPSEARNESYISPQPTTFKKPALPTPITDTEYADQASPSIRMRLETPLPQRTALVEQNTNKILTPRSSEKLKTTLRKLADKVQVVASPTKALSRPSVSFDGAADTENHFSESQYISTQTAMNFALQDFQEALESPDKRSPVKQSQMKRKPRNTWHDDIPSEGTNKIVGSAIKETPVSAPMDTQAIFDQYRFTPSTSGSSPFEARGRSTQTPVITPSTFGTSAPASASDARGRLKPVTSRSRSQPRTLLSNMMNARSSGPPKSLSQSQGAAVDVDMDTMDIDTFLDQTCAELAA